MKKAVVWSGCGALVLSLLVGSAGAFPQFKKEFDAMYPNQAENSGTLKCNLCHAGESKKMRNPYGQALDKLLSKDDTKNADKIREALKAVEPEKAPSGETFGDRIKAGKAPCG